MHIEDVGPPTCTQTRFFFQFFFGSLQRIDVKRTPAFGNFQTILIENITKLSYKIDASVCINGYDADGQIFKMYLALNSGLTCRIDHLVFRDIDPWVVVFDFTTDFLPFHLC